MTGLGRAQVTRLIGRYKEDGEVKERSYERNRFAVRYTAADIELLTAVDEAHEMLSGPATQKILYREFHEYGAEEYEPLASISVPHIYNLRKSGAYRRKRIFDQKTRPVKVAIGERRRPGPQGSLRQFPFRILGFHPDNGSEFINHTVAKLLDKLLVEQTKSRPRSNDNDLVEAKNGAVIRKHLGYGHIAASNGFLAAVPDLKLVVVQRLVAGDRVVSHMRFTGHFSGTFMGHTGAGQPVDFIATDILRVRNGRITDNWHLEDNLTFLQQIGVVAH
jgi:predicted ester cyclase